jgi:hypothetical protein
LVNLKIVLELVVVLVVVLVLVLEVQRSTGPVLVRLFRSPVLSRSVPPSKTDRV